MIDPFPIPPPEWLVAATKPLADRLSLQSLPLHIHEVIFSIALYTFTQSVLAPALSNYFCPKTYSRLSRRSKINWNVHIVSFVQACIINGLSLYVIWFDEERKVWRDNAVWENRIWAYYGSGGLCQSFALGYFLWDLMMCSMYPDIFGWGMVAHAVSAVTVFGVGYRPFIYFAAPVFLLYELSSPFLNIHWFCDKLELTGSIYQAINGAFLVGTFFSCRLVWGIYSSFWVFRDMYWLIRDGHTNFAYSVPSGKLQTMSTEELLRISRDADAQTRAFNPEQYTPLWIPVIYLASNLVLNTLNVFWFGKMIETIRTRFDPPFGTRGVGPDRIYYQPVSAEDQTTMIVDDHDSDLGVGEPGKQLEKPGQQNGGSVKAARRKAESAMNGSIEPIDDAVVQKTTLADGRERVEVSGTQRVNARSRRKA